MLLLQLSLRLIYPSTGLYRLIILYARFFIVTITFLALENSAKKERKRES
jgi:hypothetical protein